jgi:hypothetical protein
LLLTAFLLFAVPRPAPAGKPEAPTSSVEALESRTYNLVNEHRKAKRLSHLAYDARIAAVARRHSMDMAAGRVPTGHKGFEARQRELSKLIPLRGIAENVGMNDYPPSRTVEATVSGWVDSRGTGKTIEGRYDLTGLESFAIPGASTITRRSSSGGKFDGIDHETLQTDIGSGNLPSFLLPRGISVPFRWRQSRGGTAVRAHPGGHRGPFL